MKNLITTIASIILFSICLMQFVAQEITELTIFEAERTITHYAENNTNMDAFANTVVPRLKTLPNISEAKVMSEAVDEDCYIVEYTINNVIGPAKMLKLEGQNQLKKESRAYLSKPKHVEKPETHKEPSTGTDVPTPTDLPTNTDVDQGTP